MSEMSVRKVDPIVRGVYSQARFICKNEEMSEMSEKSDIIAKTVILIDLWKLRKC